MKNLKQMLCWILTVSMVLGLLPSSALATGSAGFKDVRDGDWFYEAVEYVTAEELMVGVGGNKFDPNGQTTRAMVVTVLYRMEDSPVAGGAGFADIEDGKWYTNAILWAQSNGIVNGYNDGTFRPNTPMTREEMVAVIYRYSTYKGQDVSESTAMSVFSDHASIHSYASDAMSWAVAVGLIKGFPDGTIRPQGESNRAQLATVLMRFQRILSSDVTYTVTFKTNGGSEVASQSIYAGECAYRPANPTKEGYVFENWYMDADLTVAYDFTRPITADITLYANWIPLDVQIFLDVGNYADNIVNRIVNGSISYNIAIESITYELVSANNVVTGEIDVADAAAFMIDVLLEDGENTFTVYVVTADSSVISKSVTMTYDSGYVYDKNDDRLILIPIWYDDDTGREPDEYLVANILSLYFYDHTTFEDRVAFITDILGGEVVGYLNTLDMMQVLLPDILANAEEAGYTGETDLNAITEDEVWEYADALAVAYCDILESADPEYIYNNMEVSITTNDPWDGAVDDDWWLEAIDAYEAWEYENYYNSDFITDITVAAVDSGFMDDHPDLNGHITIASDEDTPHYHGTHVAGIMVATAHNRKGLAGVLHNNGTLLAYDIGNANGTVMSDSAILDAMVKAVEAGAKAINFSLGRSKSIPSGTFTLGDSTIKRQGKLASKKVGKLISKDFDFIVVQSAGNGNADNNGVHYWNNGLFASIKEDNCYFSNDGLFSDAVTKQEIMNRILIVAAVDNNNSLTSFSNGGDGELNIIAAPGDQIYSTVTGDPNFNDYYADENQPEWITNDPLYAYLPGTSMAAPMVTAVCGLAWSVNSKLTGAEVVDLVMKSTVGIASTNTDSDSHTTGGMGIVNALNAVKAAIESRTTYTLTVVDALDGSGVSATIRIHANGPTGPLVGREQVYHSNTSGALELPKLPSGVYWLEITAEGYLPNVVYANCWGSKESVVHLGSVALTPELNKDEYRVILRWTGEPSDLDSHLVATTSEGNDYHVYWDDQNPSPAYANLDHDDVDYEGPETITITNFSGLRNIRYAVHDFTNRNSSSSTVLSKSGAYVEVYKGNTLLNTFRVPTNTGGTEWDVFAIDANGNIIPMNQMTYCDDPGSVLNGSAAGNGSYKSDIKANSSS